MLITGAVNLFIPVLHISSSYGTTAIGQTTCNGYRYNDKGLRQHRVLRAWGRIGMRIGGLKVGHLLSLHAATQRLHDLFLKKTANSGGTHRANFVKLPRRIFLLNWNKLTPRPVENHASPEEHGEEWVVGEEEGATIEPFSDFTQWLEAIVASSSSSESTLVNQDVRPSPVQQNPPLEAMTNLTMLLNQGILSNPFRRTYFSVPGLVLSGAMQPTRFPSSIRHTVTFGGISSSQNNPDTRVTIPVMGDLTHTDPVLGDGNMNCVYAWNLPPDFSEFELHYLFAPYGEMAEYYVEDNLARFDGGPIIRYYAYASARDAVVNMDGHMLNERRVTVVLMHGSRKDDRNDEMVYLDECEESMSSQETHGEVDYDADDEDEVDSNGYEKGPGCLLLFLLLLLLLLLLLIIIIIIIIIIQSMSRRHFPKASYMAPTVLRLLMWEIEEGEVKCRDSKEIDGVYAVL
ncbi:hypothetical protein EGR_08804 [Echinococcus granulosus]|uniref:Uncharacterized protein n=1 Tax=Echinococcus granulosus TaxID=6210 RepID=W6USB4_ECHGR|nr:hypothetical protein EGR_08804 [Echinococcus granulosus]EUB56329.1 hypothetical protein EGR_08804 [Echinococcus granulosus]